MYPHRDSWRLCPIHALAVLVATSSSPSPLVFTLFKQHGVEPEIEDNQNNLPLGAVSQLEALSRGADDDEGTVISKRVRKRPSAAQYINMRLRQIQDDLADSTVNTAPLGSVPLTPGLQSHSMHRGAAQWANASYKISIQWLCSRGMWTMDAPSKAFAYVGTTLTEDQKIAKRLSCWDPDDDVEVPVLPAVVEVFTPDECAAIPRFQNILYVTSVMQPTATSNQRY
jgi:hypothetical protein